MVQEKVGWEDLEKWYRCEQESKSQHFKYRLDKIHRFLLERVGMPPLGGSRLPKPNDYKILFQIFLGFRRNDESRNQGRRNLRLGQLASTLSATNRTDFSSDVLEREEEQRLLGECLGELPDEVAEVVRGVFLRGQPVRVVAKLLRVHPTTVERRLASGLRVLRRDVNARGTQIQN